MTRHRKQLVAAAVKIAQRRGEKPATPSVALRKLFVQERRDWSRPGAPRVGWKRGELFEFLAARTPEERVEEWGDVGYYVAQTWGWLWALYALVTPEEIVARAVKKFTRRAGK